VENKNKKMLKIYKKTIDKAKRIYYIIDNKGKQLKQRRRKMKIAETILNQIGGNRFLAMTGAKNLIAHENGLAFKLPKQAKNKINYIKITLNDLDLYDVEYGNIKMKKYDFTYTVKKEAYGLYFDQLEDNFTQNTGLYTRL
jgi:hypothetical protein